MSHIRNQLVAFFNFNFNGVEGIRRMELYLIRHAVFYSTLTELSSISLSPTTSMYGTFSICAWRIL